MGLARTFSAVVMGVRAHIVEVEADRPLRQPAAVAGAEPQDVGVVLLAGHSER